MHREEEALARTAGAELRAGARVVAAAALSVGLGIAGLLTYNSGLFVAALGAETGLTRTAFGAIFFGANLAICAAMPFVARLVETRGPRLAAVLGALALAAGFLLLSRVTSVANYAAAMLLTGLFAAASAPVAHTRAVAMTFRRARGLALGLTQLGIGLAATLVPPLIGAVIQSAGWRAGFLALAGLALLAVLPALALPGRPAAAEGSRGRAAAETAVQVAWREPLFRAQIAAFTAMAFAFAGMLSHFVPMLLDSGMTIARASGIAGVIGLSVIVTRVAIGWLSDQMEPAWLAIASCVICAAGCLTLAWGGADMAVFGALALGAAMGAEADLIAILTARNFALAVYSRTYAAQYAAFTIAAGASPLWIGAVSDMTGGYRLALMLCAALLAIPALLFLWIARHVWPSGGLVDTEMRCFHRTESRHAEKEAQPGVQA